MTIGREYRLVVKPGPDVRRLREDLIDLAGGFTKIEAGRRLRYIVCLPGRDVKPRVQELVEAWRGRGVAVSLEDEERSPDRDELYFLLPLQRNPDPAGGHRRPLFTNEDMAGIPGAACAPISLPSGDGPRLWGVAKRRRGTRPRHLLPHPHSEAWTRHGAEVAEVPARACPRESALRPGLPLPLEPLARRVRLPLVRVVSEHTQVAWTQPPRYTPSVVMRGEAP